MRQPLDPFYQYNHFAGVLIERLHTTKSQQRWAFWNSPIATRIRIIPANNRSFTVFVVEY